MSTFSKWGSAMRSRRIAVIAVVALSCLFPTEAGAQNWVQFTKGNFPARVSALDWGNGSTLTSGRNIAFGRWSVSFGQNVGAFFSDNTDDFGPAADWAIFVRGLSCSNAAVGSVGCFVRLVKGGSSVSCSLEAVEPKDKPNLNTGISCPTQLRLE